MSKYQAQFDGDIRARIAELKSGLRQAEKLKCDMELPANEFGGAFTDMYSVFRLCDVQGYIDWVEEQHGL